MKFSFELALVLTIISVLGGVIWNQLGPTEEDKARNTRNQIAQDDLHKERWKASNESRKACIDKGGIPRLRTGQWDMYAGFYDGCDFPPCGSQTPLLEKQ